MNYTNTEMSEQPLEEGVFVCVWGGRCRKSYAISEYGNGNGKIYFISDNERNGKIYSKILIGTSKGTKNRSGRKGGRVVSKNRN